MLHPEKKEKKRLGVSDTEPGRGSIAAHCCGAWLHFSWGVPALNTHQPPSTRALSPCHKLQNSVEKPDTSSAPMRDVSCAPGRRERQAAAVHRAGHEQPPHSHFPCEGTRLGVIKSLLVTTRQGFYTPFNCGFNTQAHARR